VKTAVVDGDAGRSGALGVGRRSWVATTAEGPATLCFLWRAAFGSADRLTFRLDDVATARASGATPWLFATVKLPEGRHALQWEYFRGSRAKKGAHAGWLDSVVLEPPEIDGTLAVRAPSGSAAWRRGRRVTIRWEHEGTIGPAVNVRLLTKSAGARWRTIPIAGPIADTGSYVWKVPASLARGAKCKIRVVACANPAIFGDAPGLATVK
jgi:hypothetical protein